MKEKCVIVTLTATTEEWTEVQSLANEWNRGQGWQHHREHKDHQQYLSDNKHIHEDVGGVLVRDVSLADTRKGAYGTPAEVVVLRNGSDNQIPG